MKIFDEFENYHLSEAQPRHQKKREEIKLNTDLYMHRKTADPNFKAHTS